MNILGFFQRLGRALQLLIAVLPVAALLLRFGQSDLLNVPLIAQAGGAIFDNPALIFAIGVASNWSEDSAGVTALAGTVGYFVLTKAMVTINPIANMDVLVGIVTSLVGGTVYNRWSGIKLPDFLSFFGGEQFVSTITGFFCLVLAAISGYVQSPIQNAIHVSGEWIVGTGTLGPGIFGLISRLLVPTSLHQVLNTIAWFQIGELASTAGTAFHGDINRSYAGDGTAGVLMSGFFPVTMFGLPGATLAMYFAAPKARRPMVGGMLLSVATTAFLTGVAEPLELLLTFLAPLLYLLHTLLTGISLFVVTLLGIHAGFSFSAGAIGYVLIYNLSAAGQNVWMLVVTGLVFSVIYSVLLGAVIRMFNLKTPGREDKEDNIATEEASSNTKEGLTQLTTNYIAAAGGTDSLKTTDTCITRPHLTVAGSDCANDVICKRLGTSGAAKLNKQTIQVIVRAEAEFIGNEIEKVVACGPVATASGRSTPAVVAPVAKPQAVANAATVEVLVSPITGDAVAPDQVPDEALASKAVGDSVAVKPTNEIVAVPAAGAIVKTFNTNHAFRLEAVKGAEIVVHMGTDTVALEGKGFKHLVEKGAEVTAGQPILEMGLEFLNANTRSMISPVMCSNSGDFNALVTKAEGHVVVGQAPLYEIKGK